MEGTLLVTRGSRLAVPFVANASSHLRTRDAFLFRFAPIFLATRRRTTFAIEIKKMSRANEGRAFSNRRWSDHASTPQGSRVAAPATPPTPNANPSFTPEVPSLPGDDWRTPCRSAMPSATPGRPPQIARRSGNPLARSTQNGATASSSTKQNDVVGARIVRVTMGLHAVVRQASELQRRVDAASAAPLSVFETLVSHVQATEELLSTVRSTIEGASQRENVCATLLRQADKMHALDEAQRLGVRTPQLTMLACNLVTSVSATAAHTIKLLRPNATLHSAPPVDGRTEASVDEARRELSLALGQVAGCGVSETTAAAMLAPAPAPRVSDAENQPPFDGAEIQPPAHRGHSRVSEPTPPHPTPPPYLEPTPPPPQRGLPPRRRGRVPLGNHPQVNQAPPTALPATVAVPSSPTPAPAALSLSPSTYAINHAPPSTPDENAFRSPLGPAPGGAPPPATPRPPGSAVRMPATLASDDWDQVATATADPDPMAPPTPRAGELQPLARNHVPPSGLPPRLMRASKVLSRLSMDYTVDSVEPSPKGPPKLRTPLDHATNAVCDHACAAAAADAPTPPTPRRHEPHRYRPAGGLFDGGGALFEVGGLFDGVAVHDGGTDELTDISDDVGGGFGAAHSAACIGAYGASTTLTPIEPGEAPDWMERPVRPRRLCFNSRPSSASGLMQPVPPIVPRNAAAEGSAMPPAPRWGAGAPETTVSGALTSAHEALMPGAPPPWGSVLPPPPSAPSVSKLLIEQARPMSARGGRHGGSSRLNTALRASSVRSGHVPPVIGS